MREIKLHTSFLALLLSICLLMPACKQKQANEPVEKDETGIVVPGQGMDGVKLGDSRETVIKKLGQPTSQGWTDGPHRYWRSFDYDIGSHAGLSIDFLEESDGSFGPVDGLRATGLYQGKTKEGIGIGSTLETVHDAYGTPDISTGNPDGSAIAEFYCLENKKLEIHYIDSIITTLSLGYYIPMPENPLYPCK